MKAVVPFLPRNLKLHSPWPTVVGEGGAERQIHRQTDKHINTRTRPGLGAGPSDKKVRNATRANFQFLQVLTLSYVAFQKTRCSLGWSINTFVISSLIKVCYQGGLPRLVFYPSGKKRFFYSIWGIFRHFFLFSRILVALEHKKVKQQIKEEKRITSKRKRRKNGRQKKYRKFL